MAPNFKTLLSVPLDSVERPKNLPGGPWYGQIKDWSMIESGEKKTPGIQFNIQYTRPGESISPEELDGVDLQKLRTGRITFWISEDAIYRLKEFMISCGVDTSGRTIAEALPDLRSAEVLCDVGLEPSKNRDGSMKLDGQGNPEYFNQINRISGTAGA